MKDKIVRNLKVMLGIAFLVAGIYVSYDLMKKDNLSLKVVNDTTTIESFCANVEELLLENNVEYDENDIITPSLDTKLEDNMKIEVTKVEVITKKEFETVPFTTDIVKDEEILIGDKEIKQEGSEGKKESIYEVTYINNELKEEKLVSYNLSQMPTTKVVHEGTKKPEPVQVASAVSRGETSRDENTTSNKNNSTSSNNSSNTASNNTSSSNNSSSNNNSSNNSSSGSVVTFSSTAYCTGSITATGTKPRWGVIAVDPKVIPYGTKVYIPVFDMVFTAEDCGGAIKGNIIDIYMNSRTDALNWGRRNVEIQILK